MKKLVLAAALIALAGCGEKKADEAPMATPDAAAAPAPAPATTDSMAMKHDSTPMAGDTAMKH
jgi:predicted small lipoprotein YifL